jgi:hypothetical protein
MLLFVSALSRMEITKYSDDIPEEVFIDQLRSWQSISRYGESGSIYTYHKGIVLRRHQALIERPDLIKSLFQNKLPILIDNEFVRMEDYESAETEFHIYESAVPNPTYWICGIDSLLVGKSEAFFHYLRKRQAANPKISYVLFFSVNFLHQTVRNILTYTSTFLQNTYITPLFNEETGKHFLKALSIRWKFDINQALSQKILFQTARHFLTLKQAARFIRDTKSDSLEAILQHDMMRIKLKSIYDGFLPFEQSALSKIIIGANDFTPDESESIEFFKKTQWLESRGHKLELTVPILTSYLDSMHVNSQTIQLDGDRLMIGSIPINGLFSEQEIAVFNLLVRNRGKVVLRDGIANAIWGEDWNTKYSDWAIDQIISRIRKKCLTLDLPKTIIRVVKGKGFQYG